MELLQTIDDVLSGIRNKGDISLEDYVSLREKGKKVLRVAPSWEEDLSYVRDCCEEIRVFIQNKDEEILEKLVSEFNQNHAKFENEYLSCDAETIRQRRAQLDELAENYCLIGFESEVEACSNIKTRTKHDKGVRRYVNELVKRGEIKQNFEEIKAIYERYKTDGGDLTRLKNLAVRKLIGGSSLNLTNIIASYRKAHYEEGAVEAEKLQNEIKGCIKGKVSKRKTAYVPEQSETAETEQGYFCLTSHMLSLGSGPSNQTYEIYRALTEDGKSSAWHQRLQDLGERISMFAPSFRRGDYEYVKTVRDYVNRSAKRGELALLAAHNGYGTIVRDLMNSLNQYLASSEALIREQSVQKAALAV